MSDEIKNYDSEEHYINPESNEAKLSEFESTDTPTYTKLSDKYSDVRSSAATMLLLGIIGCIVMTLIWTNIIRLPFSATTAWLFYSILTGIFVIFVVAGIVSYMHAKQVKIDASEEDKLIADAKVWAKNNLSKENIDLGLDTSQPFEVLYFEREVKIRKAIMTEFVTMDEGLAALLSEEIYQSMYEN